MKHSKWSGGILSAVILGFFSLTGCQDGNLFGRLHDRGDSGSISSLLSDAGSALRDRNYTQALAIYEQILAQDSDNAQALMGAAAAQLGTTGLSLGQVIANVLNQTSGAGSSSSNLRELVRSAGSGGHSQAVDPNSLLSGIDLPALNAVIDTVICRLQKIASGATDGSIASNDVDTLVNLAVMFALRAALDAQTNGLIDITNSNGTWGFAQGSAYGTFCNPSNDAAVVSIATDLAGAYAALDRVANLLNLSGNQIIVQLRADINTITADLLNTGLPVACRNTLTTNGITSSNFTTFFNLNTPPSGC